LIDRTKAFAAMPRCGARTRRRSHQRVEGHVMPASEKPTQYLTHAVQHELFDHLVGKGEQLVGHGKAERLCGLEVDH
jgi:hypothetical protein